MTEIRNSYTYDPKSGGKPDSLVILLHGLGANGQDLIGLAPEWAGDLPDTVFVSPDAPFECDMAPFGFQWFSLLNWSEDQVITGIKEAQPVLNDFIDAQLKKYNLSEDRLVLCGFSQGSMMSLYTAPRRDKACAGVLAYSGALMGAKDFKTKTPQKMPVCLFHGMMDPVVPVAAYYQAKEELEGAGFEVSGNLSPALPHGIDDIGIAEGRKFLKKVLL